MASTIGLLTALLLSAPPGELFPELVLDEEQIARGDVFMASCALRVLSTTNS